TWTIDAYAHCIAAQMPTPCTTVAAEAAGDMAFARHAVADREATHFLPHLDNFAHIFVTHMHGHGNGLLRPLVPFPDMDVGAADGRARDADHHVVMADFRLLDASQRQARCMFQFCQCFHGGLDVSDDAQ